MAEPPQAVAAADIAHLARLAHLRLESEELGPVKAKLEALLAYVRLLDGLDLTHVPPTDHASAAAAALRPDEVHPGLPVEVALANAPERMGDGFGVPKIVE